MTTTTAGMTRAQVDQLCEDHPEYRTEITTDGLLEISVTPARIKHNRTIMRLSRWLADLYGEQCVITEAGVSTSRTDPEPYRVVDILVTHEPPDDDEVYIHPGNVLLIVEVLSPRTRRVDLTSKPAEFGAAGIANYWTVDAELVTRWRLGPNGALATKPGLTMSELTTGRVDLWLAR